MTLKTSVCSDLWASLISTLETTLLLQSTPAVMQWRSSGVHLWGKPCNLIRQSAKNSNRYHGLHLSLNMSVIHLEVGSNESTDSNNQKPVSPSDKRVSPTQHLSSFPVQNSMLHLWNVHNFVTRQFHRNYFPGSSAKGLVVRKRTGMFLSLFKEKDVFKITTFFSICAFGVERKLFSLEKISNYAVAGIGKLCRSVSPHPVRCTVNRGKDISRDCNCNFLCPNGWIEQD